MRPYKILYSPYKILELVERDIFSTESISPIYPVFLLTVATVYTVLPHTLFFFRGRFKMRYRVLSLH